MTSRSWCYTINNYGEGDVEFVKRLPATRHVASKEIGESGTPHIQGSVTFTSPFRLSALKKLHATAHWEITKSVTHSEMYCMKADSEVIINVNNSKQGKRSDLESACEILKTEGLKKVAEECPTVFVKYHRGLNALKTITQTQPENFVKMDNLVLIGEPGIGKTRRAFEMYPDLYQVSIPHKKGQLWFDNYDGQDVILIDDFYGEIQYSLMLRLLDGYRMQVQTKGGFVNKNWTKVIITSNDHPEEWYLGRMEVRALKRRVTVEIMKHTDTVTEVSR